MSEVPFLLAAAMADDIACRWIVVAVNRKGASLTDPDILLSLLGRSDSVAGGV